MGQGYLNRQGVNRSLKALHPSLASQPLSQPGSFFNNSINNNNIYSIIRLLTRITGMLSFFEE